METSQEERYMRRCLEIARHGGGHAAPNPMVGAVLVCDGAVIGEGFHACCGGPHAEVAAVRAVRDPALLSRATLYVSLEPCCHYGKTPPCTELILQHHIPRVVVACSDPNPQVGGKGIRRLREQGCEVVTGVLEAEAGELNRRFFTFQEKKRPYIILKWAQSLDGFMDVARDGSEPESYWITNDALKIRVHQWRAEEPAIWVGANTILNDNPQLNVRYGTGRQPVRITFFDRMRDDLRRFHFFDHTQPSLLFHFGEEGSEEHLSFCHIPEFKRLPDGTFPSETLALMLQKLYERNLTTVMVEGGRRLLDSLLAAGLWDEARVLVGNCRFGRGLEAPQLPQTPAAVETVADNKVLYYRNLL